MKKILNWISIIIAVLAIFLVYLIFTQKDRKGAINVAEETLQYLKNGCIMYDNYSLGRESKDLMTIRSAAGVLTDYFGKTELTDEAWLTGYAENQNLTGIILTDQNGELLAGSEAAEYGIWTDILKKKNILDIADNRFAEPFQLPIRRDVQIGPRGIIEIFLIKALFRVLDVRRVRELPPPVQGFMPRRLREVASQRSRFIVIPHEDRMRTFLVPLIPLRILPLVLPCTKSPCSHYQ